MAEGTPTDVVRPKLARALTRAARDVAARLENALKPHGLTFDQWLVLETLTEESGLSMSALAARTGLSGPTLTRLIDRLASNALLYREVAPEDRRRAEVHLARRGRDTFERLVPVVAELEGELRAELRGAGIEISSEA